MEKLSLYQSFLQKLMKVPFKARSKAHFFNCVSNGIICPIKLTAEYETPSCFSFGQDQPDVSCVDAKNLKNQELEWFQTG